MYNNPLHNKYKNPHEQEIFTFVSRGTDILESINNSNYYPLVAVKMKSSAKYPIAYPVCVTTQCITNAVFMWCLHVNPTFLGTALIYSDVNSNTSSLQVAIPTKNTTIDSSAVGHVFDGGYVRQEANAATNAPLVLPKPSMSTVLSEGQNNILALSIRRVDGGNEDYIGSITFRETIEL